MLTGMGKEYISKVYEIWEDENYYYIVSEVCEGGELLIYISNQVTLTEQIAA